MREIKDTASSKKRKALSFVMASLALIEPEKQAGLGLIRTKLAFQWMQACFQNHCLACTEILTADPAKAT